MVRRHELSDEQWNVIKSLIPGKKSDPERTGRNNRLFINAVLFVLADSHLKCNGSELSSGSDGMGFEAVYCWKVNTAGSWIVVRTMHYSTENLRCRTTSLLLKNAKSSLSYIIRALVRQRSLST